MADEEDITVELDMRGYLALSAEKAAEAIQHLANNLKQANRQLLTFSKRGDKAADTCLKLAAAAETYNGASAKQRVTLDELNKSVTMYNDKTKESQNQTKRTTNEVKKFDNETKKAEKDTKKLTKSLGFLNTGLKKLALGIKFGVMGLGAAGLAGYAGIATQAVLGLVAQLVSLAAFAAFIPVGIGAIALTMLSLKVATHGVGAALQGVFSGSANKKQIQAMKGLSAAAKDFVSFIADQVPALKSIRMQIQENFFNPFLKSFKMAFTLQVPIWKAGMGDITNIFGEGIDQIFRFIGSLNGQHLFTDLFDAGKASAFAFETSVGAVMLGIADVVHAVTPEFVRLAGNAGQLATQFGQWLSQISNSGKLLDWLHQAEQTASGLWHIFKDVWDILRAVVSVAGTDALSTIGNLLDLVVKFLQAPSGKQAVQDLFTALAADAKLLTPLIQVLASALATVLTPSIQAIVTNLAPGFIVFLQGVSDALKILIPYWGPLSKAVSDLLIALTPLLPVIGQFLGLVGGEAIQLLSVLVPIISTFAGSLAGLLGPALTIVTALLAIAAPYIQQFAQQFGAALMQLIPLFVQIGQQLLQSAIPFMLQFGQVLAQVAPTLTELAVVIVGLFVQALQQLIPYLPQLFNAFFQLLGVMIQLLPAILPLVEQFIQMAPQIFAAIGPSTQLAIVLLQLATVSLRVLAAIDAFAVQAYSKISGLVSGVRSVFNALFDILTAPFRAAKAAISGIIDAISGSINSIISKVSGIGGILNKLNPFKFAGGPVSAGTYTVGEIGKELFIPNSGGQPQMLGEHGMEDRTFPTGGFIVPSFMLSAMERVEASMSRSMAEAADVMVTAGRHSGVERIENNYNVTIPVASTNASSEEIAAAVKKAIQEVERDKKERS